MKPLTNSILSQYITALTLNSREPRNTERREDLFIQESHHWGVVGDKVNDTYNDSLLISRRQYVQTITTHIQWSILGEDYQGIEISNRQVK